MKNLNEKLKGLPTNVVILVSFVVFLILSVAIGFLLVMPSIFSRNTLQTEIQAQQEKLGLVQANITSLRNEDQENIKTIRTFIDTLVPSTLEMLHFTALSDVVARASGVSVTNFQVVKGVAAKPNVTTAAGVTTGPASTAGAGVQTAPTTVKVTYASNFDSLLTLLKFWTLADQLVGVKDITLLASAGALSYTITYDLPITAPVTAGEATERQEISAAEKEKINTLMKKVIYKATPSAGQLGKDNPFQ